MNISTNNFSFYNDPQESYNYIGSNNCLNLLTFNNNNNFLDSDYSLDIESFESNYDENQNENILLNKNIKKKEINDTNKDNKSINNSNINNSLINDSNFQNKRINTNNSSNLTFSSEKKLLIKLLGEKKKKK